jgi:hypothetical protein
VVWRALTDGSSKSEYEAVIEVIHPFVSFTALIVGCCQ